MGLLDNALDNIEKIDESLFVKAQERLDSLTKPRGSLGRLEEFARQMVAITGELRPVINKKIIFTFAGDHGVADEGVSAFPKEVTPQMVINFLQGGAGINVLARHGGVEVVVVDIGVDFDFGSLDIDLSKLKSKKVVNGTGNIRKGPAMTPEETIRSIEVGIELAGEYASEGIIFGTGEMGIANTTPSSALISAFSGRRPVEVTGHGTGITDEAFAHKVKVIEDALALNKPNNKDPLDVLGKVGGTEIAGITGLILGAAARRLPVVIDGFISTAGALVAYELCPTVKDYLFAAHRSVEKGHEVMLDHMGLRPIVDLDLRLGEGTGAAIAMGLVEAGLKIYNEMATFGDAGVSEEA